MANKTRASMSLEVGDRLAKPKSGHRVRIARGESESVEVCVELLDGGRPFDAAGLSARFMAVLAGGRHVAMPVPPEGVSGSTLAYTLPSGLGATPGDTRLAVFELSDGDGYRIYTEPFTVSVTEGPSPTSAEIGPYVPELDALVAQLRAATEAAESATDKADASATKAEAASDAAGKATASATKAASDAQAAISEVKATEAKLYPVAENTLVRSETGTVAHVNDAFASASLRKITVEGACKQDGIPSPDAPKAITVIENPVVKVVGRNLCQGFDYGQIDTSGNQTSSSTTSSCRTGFIPVAGGASYVLSLSGVANSATAKGRQYDSAKSYLGSVSLASGKSATLKSECAFLRYEFDESVKGDAKKLVEGSAHAQIEQGSSPTEYKSYTSQPIAFTLPAEHPYLAKLPDGTADEIVVDEEGNVELVARVAKVLLSELVRYAADDAAGGASYAGIVFANTSQTKGRVLCSAYQPTTGSAQSGTIYCPNKTTIIVRDSRFTSKEKAIELLDGVVAYVAVEQTRYSLGKIEMPKAQDSIVNAWTDAEVTPNMGIWYVRDVNIVVANIESAIASITEG